MWSARSAWCAGGLVAAALLLFGAHVGAQGLPVGFSWELADDRLRMAVDADDTVDDLRVELREAGRRGSVEVFERGRLDARGRWTFEMRAPSGDTTYEVTIQGTHAGDRGELGYAFDVAFAAPLDFEIDTDAYDPNVNRLVMTMNQPAGHAEITVRGDDGSLLAERVIRFAGEAPGTPLTLTWSQSPGEVLTIDVKAVAENGSWSSRQYIPWQVEFDAVHVNFATGSSEIPASDFAMLDARLAEINATIDRVSEWVRVELYVGGYTDTVGGAADNQRLSEDRARSLGRFFRDRGVSIDIYYQGFGETALAVPTEDNVDEPANRRALFILTTREPPISENVPRSNWRRL